MNNARISTEQTLTSAWDAVKRLCGEEFADRYMDNQYCFEIDGKTIEETPRNMINNYGEQGSAQVDKNIGQFICD